MRTIGSIVIRLTRASTSDGRGLGAIVVAHGAAMIASRLVFVLCTSVLAACSGAGASIPAAEGTEQPGTSASPTDPTAADAGGSATPPSAVPPPGGGAPGDPALVVADKAAPECHDLAQRGSLIATAARASTFTAGAPLAAPPSGLYVVAEIVEWETEPGAASSEPPSRTTVFVTPARWYYVNESEKEVDRATASWSIADGWLSREVTCRVYGAGQKLKQQIWASQAGFTVLASSRAGRPLTVRYERRD